MSTPAKRASARGAASATKGAGASDGAPVLPIIAGATLTAKGLQLDPNLTLEEVYDVGKQLATMLVTIERLAPWVWGDFLLELEHRGVSDAAVKKWVEVQQLAYGTRANYKSLAKAFPRGSRRREKLTIGHHAAVAGLPVAEADQLLREAEATNMSRPDLRAKAKALLRNPKPDDDGDDITDKTDGDVDKDDDITDESTDNGADDDVDKDGDETTDDESTDKDGDKDDDESTDDDTEEERRIREELERRERRLAEEEKRRKAEEARRRKMVAAKRERNRKHAETVAAAIYADGEQWEEWGIPHPNENYYDMTDEFPDLMSRLMYLSHFELWETPTFIMTTLAALKHRLDSSDAASVCDYQKVFDKMNELVREMEAEDFAKLEAEWEKDWESTNPAGEETAADTLPEEERKADETPVKETAV